ncbi:adenosylcobinamide-GDP ribazoletransferase [Phaeovibrio sulfidiphilus]|uniref:Adenosylcobinamide-GDP ribazoletransferase n=1 Tax=Phaeovibrio sulfidiphilus TaxID=1220600 RepID=A0A8J7CEE7_9PROT|nr:adenosylcobinamide-GDP ribazoletransferase [Phaeovibrio sulfidiphilus]
MGHRVLNEQKQAETTDTSGRSQSSEKASRLSELACAIGFLTRLPPALRAGHPPLARCVWAFPVAGALVGGIGALVALAGVLLGLPALATGFLAVGSMIIATGALHEDGLSDTADGMGAFTRERALEIMRDSRIGTYGALTLIVMTGLRASAISGIVSVSGAPEAGRLIAIAGALVAAAALGRASCGLVLASLDPARKDGLGAQCGRPGPAALAVAFGFSAALAFVFLPVGVALCGILAGLVPVLWLIRSARRRLGGQTGDIVGAASVLCETTALLAFAALL